MPLLNTYDVGTVLTEEHILEPWILPLGGEYDYATVIEVLGDAITLDCHMSGRSKDSTDLIVLSKDEMDNLLGWDIAKNEEESIDSLLDNPEEGTATAALYKDPPAVACLSNGRKTAIKYYSSYSEAIAYYDEVK